jgi:hypothetical protein
VQKGFIKVKESVVFESGVMFLPLVLDLTLAKKQAMLGGRGDSAAGSQQATYQVVLSGYTALLFSVF